MSVCVVQDSSGFLQVVDSASSLCDFVLAQSSELSFDQDDFVLVISACAGLYAISFVFKLCIRFILNK